MSTPCEKATADRLDEERYRRRRIDDWTSAIIAGDISSIEERFLAEAAVGPRIVWSPKFDDLTVDPLRFLHSFWTQQTADREIPLAKSVDPVELRPALGYIALLEPNTDASDFRYRLYGSILAFISGFDLTGRLLSSSPASAYIWDFHLAGYRAVIQRRIPLATVHRPSANVSVTTWHRLVLPLADDEGRIIRLLSGIVPVSTRGSVIASD